MDAGKDESKRKCQKNMIYKAKVKSANGLEWQLPNFGVKGNKVSISGFLG